ncbi:hypothetical protein KEM54_002746 [Ascosphaera aggregata]|nr:hypothetical protein KEM54_002746 [Ascosphaera aggregata]
MFGIIADLISSVLTILFPIYASYKALRTYNPNIIVPWLMYWVVIAIFTLVESWTYWIISWTPFYSWIRLGFLSYLVLPQTQGAKVIYQVYLDPWLYQHESQIEEAIVKGHEYARKMGAQYMEQAIDFVRQKLGFPPIDRVQQQQQQQRQQQQQPPHQQGSSAAALASALLAKFNMPGAASTGAGGAGNQWYGQSASESGSTSELFSQFVTGLSGLASRVSSAASNSPQNVMPSHMQNASPEEQSKYLREQKENLANLLKAYDTAQHNLSNARGVNAEGNHGLQQRRGSKTEGDESAQGSSAHWS